MIQIYCETDSASLVVSIIEGSSETLAGCDLDLTLINCATSTLAVNLIYYCSKLRFLDTCSSLNQYPQ